MKLKILFLGLGSIGQRHARLLKENFPHELYALRSLGLQGNDLYIPEIGTWDEASGMDVAFITSPTHLHIPLAIKAAEKNCHLFLEKPIGVNTEGLEELISLVEGKKLTSYVAYPLRHHPFIQQLKEYLTGKKIVSASFHCGSYLPDWRPGQNHLENYSASTAKGGGVILDLSHEIDLSAYLLGPVTELNGTWGKKGDVTLDAEDTADLGLWHGLIPSSIHLDYLSRPPQRTIEIQMENEHLKANLLTGTWILKTKAHEKTFHVPFERDDMFLNQLHYFFDHLGKPMMNSLEEAAPLFRKIVGFKQI